MGMDWNKRRQAGDLYRMGRASINTRQSMSEGQAATEAGCSRNLIRTLEGTPTADRLLTDEALAVATLYGIDYKDVIRLCLPPSLDLRPPERRP